MKKLFLNFLFAAVLSLVCAQVDIYGQCNPSSPNIGVQAEAFSTLTVIEGTQTILTSPVSGSSYQWVKDGVSIAGETSSILILNDFKDEDVGEYAIIVDGVSLANTVSLGILNTGLSAYDRDRLALIDLYNNTNSVGWNRNTNWLIGPIETWEGVTVTNCRVTKLVLNDNNMNGALPTSFRNLTELKYLNLKGNEISGVLDISTMSSLLSLNVSNNNFSDITFGANTLLQRVHIFNNPFTPGKTIDISNMRELIDFRAPELGLRDLVMSGTYNNLRYLIIQGNDLTGTLDMSVMPKLIICYAHNNQYTDFSLGLGEDLSRFYFYNNPIPVGKSVNISTMRNLLDFRVQGLGLRNIVTSGTYDKMLYFLIQDNQIEGTIDISGMPNLRLCYAHNNQFTDFKLGVNAELSRLYLYNNPIIPGKVMDISSMRNLLDFRIQGLGIDELMMSGVYDRMLYFIIRDNAISGKLDISGMPNLRLCYAKNNFFDELDLPSNVFGPDRELENLNVRNNNLHFDDLIPYTALFGAFNFYYNIQRDVPTTVSGNTVSVNVGGGDIYTWSDGGTGSSYTVTTSGTYFCEIRSSIIPALIIKSDPVEVITATASSRKLKTSVTETIDLYPNPVEQGSPVYIDFDGQNPEKIHFELYSITGKKVKELTVNDVKGNDYKLDTRKIAPGVYILLSEVGAKKVSRKIIIK